MCQFSLTARFLCGIIRLIIVHYTLGFLKDNLPPTAPVLTDRLMLRIGSITRRSTQLEARVAARKRSESRNRYQVTVIQSVQEMKDK